MSSIFHKSGGYRRLDSFALATIIQLGTLRFCKKFLNHANDPCGRQFDQMTQSARSGRANIIEGSRRAATSLETEMKLTDVAKASLGELQGDYEVWLLSQCLPLWKKNSPDAKAVSAVTLDRLEPDHEDPQHASATHLLAQHAKFAQWLESSDSATVANAMLILINRAIGALSNQLESQAESFKKEGGFREKLTTVRVETRAQQENAPICPLCAKPMKKRKSSRGAFWGCTAYPECRGTRPHDPENSPAKPPVPSPSPSPSVPSSQTHRPMSRVPRPAS